MVCRSAWSLFIAKNSCLPQLIIEMAPHLENIESLMTPEMHHFHQYDISGTQTIIKKTTCRISAFLHFWENHFECIYDRLLPATIASPGSSFSGGRGYNMKITNRKCEGIQSSSILIVHIYQSGDWTRQWKKNIGFFLFCRLNWWQNCRVFHRDVSPSTFAGYDTPCWLYPIKSPSGWFQAICQNLKKPPFFWIILIKRAPIRSALQKYTHTVYTCNWLD